MGAPPAAAGAGAGGPTDAGLSSSGGRGVWVSAADVWQEHPGSDHCPAWAEFRVAGGGAFPCSATGALPVAAR